MADTVVVVEDDEGVRNAIVDTLCVEGFDVRTAADGGEGLRALAAAPRPCVALVDLVMPRVDGYELVRAISALPAATDVLVVCMTAGRSTLPHGCHALLRKPFDVGVLVSTIHGAFARLKERA